jgi:aspartyl aminopeptidase
MHSIREQCCTSGTLQAVLLFQGFFDSFPSIERDLVVD